MLAFLANAATAAAAAKGGTAAKAADHAAQSGGLPQLNVQDFAPQLIWLALSFVVLYFLMSKVALPRVGEVLDERKSRIAKDLGEAQRLKTETETALANYEQALADARARAQKLIQENRDMLHAEMARERSAADANANATIAKAETQIAAAKAQAMGQVAAIANETARTIVGELIGQTVSPDEAATALASLSQQPR